MDLEKELYEMFGVTEEQTMFPSENKYPAKVIEHYEDDIVNIDENNFPSVELWDFPNPEQ